MVIFIMRVAAGEKYIDLSGQLAKESNRLARNFSKKNYSKIENIDGMLLERDISVEKKKAMLLGKLHESVVRAFSINKKEFGRKGLESLKKHLHSIRKIVLKLRSINYYLETAFMQEIKAAKIKINGKAAPGRENNFARDELEALELTAYRLIGMAVVLDKRLLSEYAGRKNKAMKDERADAKNLGSILKKESWMLEHLEAKLPPPKAATINLAKDPAFTHWAARVFALLSHIEHAYHKETIIFGQLKKNKLVRARLGKKISRLLEEKSKLIKIMQEKNISIETFRISDGLRQELRNFTTTAGL